MALRIFTSNRTEALLDQLAGLLRGAPSAPLTPETIVVQSRGMEKWLSHRLAEKLGSWSAFSFPFPNALLRTLQEQTLGPLPEADPFGKDLLAWRILGLLSDPSLASRPDDLGRYLAGSSAPLRSYQLALRLADTFDQYALYRPELLARWEREEEDEGGWQGAMWRRLAEGRAGEHRAALLRRFLGEVSRLSAPPPGFPARVSLFGIPALPPFHLQAFLAASRLCEVNLFLLNPCREYWMELRSERSLERLRLAREGEETPPEEHLEVGHPLLSSLGRQGREFLDLLLGSPVVPGFDAEEFVDPGEATLLAALQRDILVLRDRAAEGVKGAVAAGDRSLTFHSCHGPLREIEVLHDELCRLFAADPSLRLRDVLVMAPDIEVYAPFVEAVFGEEEGDRPHIPMAVGDRPARAETPLADAFLRLLDLPKSRFAASYLLDLLDIPDLRRRFGLSGDDPEAIAAWVKATRIRWGLDAGDRAREGFVPFAENSWRAGLDRLFLGTALAGDEPFAGICPQPVTGGETPALGALAALVDELAAFTRELRDDRALPQWADLLSSALDRFFLPDRASRGDIETLRGHAAALRSLGEEAGFLAPVPLAVVRHHLDKLLSGRGSARSFLSGKATFCSLLPMRSIPCRVVALVGMDGKSFPRRDSTPSFSLLSPESGTARRGDRSLRDEDRYLFLETVLSARDRLLVTWTGRSARDDSEIQPSVLVSELLDHLDGAFAPAEGGGMAERLLTRHPLQAFHPDAFAPRAGPGASFSRANAAAALARRGAREEPAPFLRRPLPEAGPERREVSLDHLRSFFANPCAFFLRHRLSLVLPEAKQEAEDSESIELAGLDAYALDQNLLAAVLGGDPESAYSLATAKGALPVGRMGRAAFEASLRGAQELAREVAPLLGMKREPLPLDLCLGPFRLTGRLSPLGEKGLVRFRAARLKARDLIFAWLDHLALNAAPGGGETFLLASDARYLFPALPDAGERMEKLLDAYWLGLRAPLAFFPESSLAWAVALRQARDGKANKGDRERAGRAAREKWDPSDPRWSRAESRDPAFRLCFGEIDPFSAGAASPSFPDLADLVFGPLLATRQEIAGGDR